MKGILSHISECVRDSIYDVKSENVSDADTKSDAFHLVNPDIGHLKCLKRLCKDCGSDFVVAKLLIENDKMVNSSSIITWNKWDYVLKDPENPKKGRRLVLLPKSGTLLELIKQYGELLKQMSYHLFLCNWNYAQYQNIKDNLKPGYLLQVLDFGQNWLNIYQDEPQGTHWDHNQTTIHPICNFYIKEGESEVVSEEHIVFSDDRVHDKFAVKAFTEISLNHILNKGFKPTHIIQFSDNASGQYKSFGPFQFLTESSIPVLRMFFSARHGKGPADGVVGRIKQAASRAVKNREAIIRDASEFHSFCEKKFVDNIDREGRFTQKFFLINDINRDSSTIVATTTPGTRSFHSVRSTGRFCVMEARLVGCCCEICMTTDGDSCPNQAYVSQWVAYNLKTGRPLLETSFVNRHWSECDVSNEDVEIVAERQVTNSHKRKVSKSISDTISVNNVTDDGLCNESVPDWQKIARRYTSFTNFEDLEEYIETLDRSMFKPMVNRSVTKFSNKFEIDTVAQEVIPSDFPSGYVPVSSIPDGNCCVRSLSTAVFGTQDRHEEIRCHLVLESVLNKDRYLNEEYLRKGASVINPNVSCVEQYALFSGQYIHGHMDDVLETIYENEIMSIRHNYSWMGMWQLWAATNVLARPVQSVFPNRGSIVFRSTFNRLCVPFDRKHTKRDKLVIMWTPTVKGGGSIQHFVPLLKK